MRRPFLLSILLCACHGGPQSATGSLDLSADPSATAGSPATVTIVAGDHGFSGTVHFSASDTAAVVPADKAYSMPSAATATISVELRTAGAHTVVAEDAVSHRRLATVPITVAPAATSQLMLTIGSACPPFSLDVAATDAFQNVTPSYSGTIHLSAPVPVGLPADYALTEGDAGHHTFRLGSGAADAHTIAVTATGGFTGQATVSTKGWCPIGPNDGPNVMALAVDPSVPSAIYANTIGGIFRSLDEGATWRSFDDGLPRDGFTGYALAATPGPTPSIYAGMFGGLYVLRPGAKSWSLVSTPINVHGQPSAIAIDPKNPLSVFVGTGAGVNGVGLLHTDGSSGFQMLTSGLPASGVGVTSIAIDPASPAVYAAYGNGELYRSANGGASWTLAATMPVSSLAVSGGGAVLASVGGSGILRSPDGGATWDTVLPYVTASSMTVIGPTIWAATMVGPYRSDDEGVTWTHAGTSASIVALQPGPNGKLYAGGISSLLVSGDGGSTWRESSDGIATAHVLSLAIDRSSDTVYAGARDGVVFTSHDHGATWTRKSMLGTIGQDVGSIVIDPQTPSTLYATGNSVCKSINGGDSWVQMQQGLEATNPYVLAIDPANPSTVYTGARDGMFKTTDGGDSWSRAGLDGAWVGGIAFDPHDAAVVYANTTLGFFRSPDRGATWSPASGQSVYLDALPVVVAPDGTVYAGGNDGVYVSTDGGRTLNHYTRLVDYYPYSLALDPDDPHALYLGTPTDVRKSTDGAKTWTTLANGLTPVSQIRALAVEGGGSIYAGVYGFSVYKTWTGGQ